MLDKEIKAIEENRDKIIKSYLSNNRIKQIIEKNNLDINSFKEHIIIPRMDQCLAILKKEIELDDEVIDDYMQIYKKYKFLIKDIIFLCHNFKNVLIKLLYEKNLISYRIESTLNYIFEKNIDILMDKYNDNFNNIREDLEKSKDIVDKYVIMSSTDLKGNIIFVSDAFCKISGYTKEELIGKPHNIVRHPDMKKTLFSDLWETIENNKVWHGEIKNKTKDNGYYWVYARVEPIFDKDGKKIGYTSIRQDITSQKEVEEQQNVIIEQSKSAAMGEMISMIAHQWRQPLQAVSILIQKLPLTKMIEGEINDDVLNEVVDGVTQQLDYMSKTIDDFRDFFRPDKKKDKIKVSELVDKSREFLDYMLRVDSIDFKIISKEDAIIEIHVNEVLQVLINIIKNARDALVERNIQNRYIYIEHFVDKDKNAIIEIKDNAGGIEEHIIDKIFEPYFSTKTNKNGTGLGLYMAKTIIEKHSNGVLSVYNSEDGAVFRILIPIKDD